jgi:serine/threonine-protein kinase
VRIGVYEILGHLGAGGMGEVYRARDARLNRDVAIKVLSESVATDPDRLARLEREAQTLAALNHPNIAQIHGVVDLPRPGGGHDTALVMECVEGEDLSQRLGRGRIPLDEAVAIARQIADALETAHERGIVHRDLKPANVKVSPNGTVKVLDFGLAVGLVPDVPRNLANSPTFTSPAVMTRAGVILGTAGYMSPEQARGKVVDRRADVWAFGCVLYEMLAGVRPFDGESLTDVLAAIVSHDPDWSRLPADTPPALRRLLARCLEKDPRRRLRDIGEARVLLEQPLELHEAPITVAARGNSRVSRLAFIAVTGGVGILAAAAGIIWGRGLRPAAVARPITRYDVVLPDKATVSVVFRQAVAASRDGSKFAFTGTADGAERIYVRARGDAEAHLLAGGDRGSNPALSPDGSMIAFRADGAIRKASTTGGATTLVTEARDLRGLTWLDSSTIVAALYAASPLVRVAVADGQTQPLTTLAAGERTHRWPDALPDGRAVLFTVGIVDRPDTYDDSRIDLVVPATGERRVVIKGAAMARYCGPGHIVYSRGTSLYAVPFDIKRLEVTGQAVEIVQGVERDASTGAAHFACSDDGTLAFVPGSPLGDLKQLMWMDRAGKGQPAGLAPGPYQEAMVSPDGSRIVLLNGTTGGGDLWIYDLVATTFTRLTFNGTCSAPTWSDDGRYVYFTMVDAAGGAPKLVRKIADGSRDAEVLRPLKTRGYVARVDEARSAVILDAVDTWTASATPEIDRGDILRVPFAAAGAAETLVSTPANEYGASVSPDGRWLAYQSDETGRAEIYTMALAGSRARRQITSDGGEEPRWSADGRELFFRTANRLMVVPIANGQAAGVPRPLFDGVYNSGIESGRSYDIDRKTGRFLLVTPARDRIPTGTIRVVLNWDAALPR